MEKAYIAVPMGDPAGIGPEIVVKALAEDSLHKEGNIVVVGDKCTLAKAMEITKVNLIINEIHNVQDGKFEPGILNLINLNNIDISKLEYGKVLGFAGKAAFDYIKKSVELALEGQVDVLATTPINKEALAAGGVNFIGHTEILADLTNSHDPLTMFEVKSLRVFFLSRHVSLRKACEMVTEERVYNYIVRCTKALEKLGVVNGKFAVAGLNPHSGENGLFGDEEVKEIMPAIKRAIKDGYNVEEYVVPADSVFHMALKGKYDAVLSLYHDQGHIATKMVDFERTIAITNNLPFLRTSVDHGTAFDIAGKGIASEVSLVEAIRLGAQYGPHFKK